MSSAPETPPRQKKPYHAPRLEFLGTTRDLTLGTASNGPVDVKGLGGHKGG